MQDHRFCTTCRKRKPVAGGYKQPGLCRGWRCEDCLNHRSVSIYASKKKAICGVEQVLDEPQP